MDGEGLGTPQDTGTEIPLGGDGYPTVDGILNTQETEQPAPAEGAAPAAEEAARIDLGDGFSATMEEINAWRQGHDMLDAKMRAADADFTRKATQRAEEYKQFQAEREQWNSLRQFGQLVDQDPQLQSLLESYLQGKETSGGTDQRTLQEIQSMRQQMGQMNEEIRRGKAEKVEQQILGELNSLREKYPNVPENVVMYDVPKFCADHNISDPEVGLRAYYFEPMMNMAKVGAQEATKGAIDTRSRVATARAAAGQKPNTSVPAYDPSDKGWNEIGEIAAGDDSFAGV